jgi:hypothetical protein
MKLHPMTTGPMENWSRDNLLHEELLKDIIVRKIKQFDETYQISHDHPCESVGAHLFNRFSRKYVNL